MISSRFWEGKFNGGKPESKCKRSGVVSLNHELKKRLCTATFISDLVLLTAGSCTQPYEKVRDFGGIYLIAPGLAVMQITHMETHPEYNSSKQHEFDIGLITVSYLPNFEK